MQLINTSTGQFLDGIPNVSNGTLLTAAWCNAVQAELAAVAQATGNALNTSSNNQVLTAIEQLIEARAGNYAPDTGVANAYVVALSPALAAYTNGVPIQFRAAHANTGACTVNAGPGVVPLLRDDGSALVAGDINAGSLVSGNYDSTAGGVLINAIVASQVLLLSAISLRHDVPILVPYPSMPFSAVSSATFRSRNSGDRRRRLRAGRSASDRTSIWRNRSSCASTIQARRRLEIS